MANFHVGGQAVLEGVMMRGERSWSVAVRSPEGEIETMTKDLGPSIDRYPFFKKPILRGVYALVETFVLGMKALSFSANAALGEEEEAMGGSEWASSIAIAVVMTVGLFMLIPFFLTKALSPFKGNVFFTLIEGTFRLSVFLIYLSIISRFKDIKRVFEYHGAEHKTINAFEAGEELVPEKVANYSKEHVRCGTSFLLIVMVVAVVVFSFLPTTNFAERMLGKVVLIPIVSGIAYELIKLSGRHPNSKALRILIWPGLMLQRLTTREPDLSQIEVAIAALKAVVPSREGDVAEVAQS